MFHLPVLKSNWKTAAIVLIVVLGVLLAFPWLLDSRVSYQRVEIMKKIEKVFKPAPPPLDKAAYDKRMEELANNPVPPPALTTPADPKAQPPLLNQGGEGGGNSVPPQKPSLWPVKTVYPNDGAILPFKRIIAYYGNLYSKKMGVLGEYPEAEMVSKLQAEIKKWNEADPNTPAIPALHYIAVVAQASAGADGKYRARMPDSEIEKVLKMAEKIPARPHESSGAGGNALVFLDIQVGLSTIEAELPRLEKYLKLPNVHLGMDPEFSMKNAIRPGKAVGTYDAKDINFAAEFLAKVVKDNGLTPKILVVHRYTQNMLTNYKIIKPLPEVQIVIHMDGWGPKAKKKSTYQQFIYREPVQFTGFKLFYKNDVWEPGTVLYSPSELLKLSPKPIYIQYQ